MSSVSAHERLVIIGSGPAGYTAAIYAARAMLRPLLLSGFEPGGQLMITTDVENYPGFAEAIQGPWLMDQMRAQAQHVGARLESEHVVALDLSQRPFRIQCDSGRVVMADAVILATGAKAKWLGIPSEEMLKGFGVSACATCDGFFFRGKKVIVVGGGNSAVEEALYLSQIAAEVTVVHRRDSFRAEKILIDRLAARPNVTFKWNRAVEEILAGGAPRGVIGAKLRDVRTSAFEELAADERVQAGGRFVEHEQVGIVGHGQREAHLGPHPLGKGLDLAFRGQFETPCELGVPDLIAGRRSVLIGMKT